MPNNPNQTFRECPFCGDLPKTYLIPDLVNQEYRVRCVNRDCGIYQKGMGNHAWNTRSKKEIGVHDLDEFYPKDEKVGAVKWPDKKAEWINRSTGELCFTIEIGSSYVVNDEGIAHNNVIDSCKRAYEEAMK